MCVPPVCVPLRIPPRPKTLVPQLLGEVTFLSSQLRTSLGSVFSHLISSHIAPLGSHIQ